MCVPWMVSYPDLEKRRIEKKIMDPMRFELMHLTILDLESSALNRSAKDPFVILSTSPLCHASKKIKLIEYD